MENNNNLFLDFKPHDEISDTLSTSAASLNYMPFEDNSPTGAQSTNSLENDVLSSSSKKIRKKRNAYQKIDDDTRLKLLEAVQNGETLKSAAKRYQVNYSSAKSIFHIYRKEGRILKKATQEKDFIFGMQPKPDVGAPPQVISMPNPNQPQSCIRPFYHKSLFSQYQPQPQPQEFRQDRMNNCGEELNGCSSPLGGLVDNFSELLKIGGNNNNNKPKEDLMKPRGFMPAVPNRFNMMMSPVHQSMAVKMPTPHQLSLASNIAQALVSPTNKIKQPDNFYMNYSNSPLSGNAKMMREGSESGSNRCMQAEFDSFSEMVSALQNQNHLTNSLNSIPKLMKQNSMTQNQDKVESKGSDEQLGWDGSLETAALDTYKSFLDAQMILSNAFMKASYLNNLVQIQRSRADGSPSPKFMAFHGN